MHKHPTLVHRVADHRRAALLEEAEAASWAVTPAARTRRRRWGRRVHRRIKGMTDVLSRIIEDFEPMPGHLVQKAD